MITASIEMLIHNACMLRDLEGGHFIHNGILYVKSRSMGDDIKYKQDVFICLDDEGHYHSDGKNITKTKEIFNSWHAGENKYVESNIGQASIVTPVTFKWKS